MKSNFWVTVATLLLFVSAAFCAASVEEEEGVLVLTEDNFDEVVNGADIILVEFYAPWCGHCKKLAPEYAKAAQALKLNDPPVPLAKLDATEHGKVASRFDVKGYPTLKVFRNGVPSDYSGTREEKGIISYMSKQAGPAAKPLNTVEAYKNFLAHPDISVVGFFPEGTGALFDTYKKVSDKMREELRFAVSSDAAVLKEAGQESPSIVIFTHEKGAEKKVYGGSTEATSLTEWLYGNSLPLAGEINANTEARYKRRGVPILKLFIDVDFTTNVKQTNYYLNRLRKVAAGDETFQNRLSFTVSDKKANSADMAKFNFEGKAEAFLAIDDFTSNKRYRFDGEVNVNSIKQFVEDFIAGKLEPFIKSEPIPENNGPVKVVVGKTFDEIVMDPTKDVLFEMYAPWCGHCKKLEPIYTELAESVKDVKNLVIAKMDATANDVAHPEYQARGYPTIFFAPANNKDHPVKYTGEREVAAFKEYLKQHATAASVKDEL